MAVSVLATIIYYPVLMQAFLGREPDKEKEPSAEAGSKKEECGIEYMAQHL